MNIIHNIGFAPLFCTSCNCNSVVEHPRMLKVVTSIYLLLGTPTLGLYFQSTVVGELIQLKWNNVWVLPVTATCTLLLTVEFHYECCNTAKPTTQSLDETQPWLRVDIKCVTVPLVCSLS